MRNSITLLGAVLAAGLLATGCAGPQQKLGRGFNNLFEVVRLAELRRSVEQSALFDSPGSSYSAGIVKGVSRTVARTGLGAFEIVTFPIPTSVDPVDYDPIWTSYLSPKAVYPSSYTPGIMEDTTFATDTSVGFSGGDIAPMIPGSRFRIFEN